MLKACVPTKDVAVWGQPPADRLGHSDDWQHACRPGLGFSSPAVGICVYLPWKHNNLPSSEEIRSVSARVGVIPAASPCGHWDSNAPVGPSQVPWATSHP